MCCNEKTVMCTVILLGDSGRDAVVELLEASDILTDSTNTQSSKRTTRKGQTGRTQGRNLFAKLTLNIR
jgi:hypothetical protein